MSSRKIRLSQSSRRNGNLSDLEKHRPSASWKPGKAGLVIAMTTVFMAPGTYPQGLEEGMPGRKTKKNSAHEGIALKKYPANI